MKKYHFMTYSSKKSFNKSLKPTHCSDHKHQKVKWNTTKSALHRTRLRFSDHKNFSVFFFYKPTRQPAP
ncbi:hypothetical protein R0L47_22615 [Pectobacterium polonicum]|uniref:hypothetical protein n=1 Tax=Pectobacterium polonicum TaxID=2485124 RepID=UPI00142ED71D|nr:hypothetical protein [Pectobacterium polonicum]